MIRVFLARLLLTVLAVASFAGIVWEIVDDRFIDELSFRIEPQGQVYVVRARSELPLPAALAEGDIIDLKQMSVLDRAALFVQDSYWSGTAVTLRLRGNDQLVRVAAGSPGPATRSSLLSFRAWGFAVTLSFLLAVGLLTLWRGREATAAWMCAFAIGVLLESAALGLITSPLVSLWFVPVREVIRAVYVGAVYGMAVSAARAGLTLVWRRVCLVLVVFLVSAVAVERLSDDALKVFLGSLAPQWIDWSYRVFAIGALSIAVLTLLAGYVHAPPDSRRRLRWILVSTALLTASVLSSAVIPYTSHPILNAVSNIGLFGLSLLGYLYAILRTRIVDVTVVIDRALVYSVLTAIVFGLFSLLEEAVHRLALGEQLSWIVQAAGALGVAAAMSPLHRLLDNALERVFFHKLRMMATALRTLGKESAFFESEDALMARALMELRVPCASAAIYERSGAVYVRRVSEGEGWPVAVGPDDPLFVTLRAGRQVLDLKGRKSAAASEGLAFPMAIGQILTGAVLVRLREGEQMDSEVRAAVAELAQALGTSLYLLRYRELAGLATEISSGKLDPQAARSRATALAGVL